MSSSSSPPPVPPWSTKQSTSVFKVLSTMAGIFIFFGVLIVLPMFVWFGCRIEPKQDQIAILIRKTGEPLAPDEIIATKEGQQGIQEAVLPEGRYFKNPFTWGWTYAKVVDIHAGQLGVKTRLFGKDLPTGEIIAKEGTKGIVADVMRPGKERVNPFAYDVKILDAITIKPGHVGVVTRLTGKDVLNDSVPPEARNSFLVSNDLKGVVSETLDPGTYYLNPYMYDVREVSLQSQRFVMGGDETINFLTQDGFSIYVEGTIEFAINRDFAAMISHRIGDMDDVLKKIILPRARGFIRLEGSKLSANNFIVGETRQLFQDSLEKHLRERCEEWGVQVKAVLIRNIEPPKEIATIIREREVAVQTAKKIDQEITQAISKADLTRQETLAIQNKEKVEQDTIAIKATIKAQQEQSVAVTAAEREMSVAKLESEAAKSTAAAQISKATAERDVVKLDNEAQAAVLASQVAAFGTGENFARYTLNQKLAPRIQSILTGDDKESIGGAIFPVKASQKEVQP